MATSEPVLEVDCSESFTNGLLDNLWDMKTHGELTDLTIIAANVPIPCHCNVMAAASKHVRDLLKGPMKEDTNKEIELNFDEVYVHRVVDYCYTGKISIELSAAKSYLRIVENFHLTELKAHIDEFLCEHVSTHTCIGWYSMAKEFSLSGLEKKSRVIIAVKFKEVTEHMEFHQLPVRELIDCIKLVKDADTVLEACFSWVMINLQSRSKDFLDLLTHIQLNKCSPQCVERVLQSWKPIWPNYTEVQLALSCRPRASAVPMGPARPRKLTMLLFGGYTNEHDLNSKLWRIDLTDGTCKLFAILDDRSLKFEAGYCATPERLFVIGGTRGYGEKYQPLRDCHALYVQDSQCESWPGMEDPVTFTAAICVNDHIYTFGGSTAPQAVYRLNLTTKRWTRCRDMPVGNRVPILAAIQHMVYMIFNTWHFNDEYRPSSRTVMYCFDTSALTWTSLTPLPVSIQDTCGARAVSVGEDIYLVGGQEKLCARYSPRHNTWTVLEKPTVVHRSFSVVHMHGNIILCGGCDNNLQAHDIIKVYNIAQNSWRVHPVRMPVGLFYHHCAVYDEVARKIVM